MAEQWRAFYGQWGEWAHIDLTGGWEVARAALMTALEPFRTDDCPECRRQGIEILTALAGLPEEIGFEDGVDGDDVLLLKVV